MSTRTSPGMQAFLKNLWADNPVFRQVLGICSTLAVTNRLTNTAIMCAGLVFTTALSGFTVSLLRNVMPRQVRMMAQVLIIAAYVIFVDIMIRAFFPEIHKVIGPYVGLIITNCIIMGRCEAFAMQNPPGASFLDGVGAGLGYTFVLMAIAFVRELMGFGTVFGMAVPLREVWWRQWTIMVMPPGAFFMLALATWFANSRTAPAAEQSAGAS